MTPGIAGRSSLGDNMQRRLFIAGALATMATAGAQAQSFGRSQAADGVREALDQAARLATRRLGVVDGYWGDPQVRIDLPRSISRLQSTLRPLGMSGQLDNLELGLNRAAESAMPQAREIFLSVIRGMTVRDAVDIVRGSDTAATDYLRRRSGSRLASMLEPPMENAMGDAGVYRTLNRIEPHVNRGNDLLSRFGLGSVSSDDLAGSLRDHAVEKTLDGVFYYIGEEERAIRRDPLGQASSLLRRVFG